MVFKVHTYGEQTVVRNVRLGDDCVRRKQQPIIMYGRKSCGYVRYEFLSFFTKGTSSSCNSQQQLFVFTGGLM